MNWNCPPHVVEATLVNECARESVDEKGRVSRCLFLLQYLFLATLLCTVQLLMFYESLSTNLCIRTFAVSFAVNTATVKLPVASQLNVADVKSTCLTAATIFLCPPKRKCDRERRIMHKSVSRNTLTARETCKSADMLDGHTHAHRHTHPSGH